MSWKSNYVKFSYQNLVDAASVSASASSGDLAIANVQDPRTGKRWRAMGPSAWGQADFGVNVSIDVVALAFPRDTPLATGTIQHQFDADGGTPGTGAVHDSTAIDIGLIDGYGIHVYQLASTISARYWRWTYELTSAYADTGRAWAGTVWQPDCNFIFGASDQWDDLSTVSQSKRSGAEFVDEKPRQREMSFHVDFMGDADMQVSRELQRICGLSSQLLVIKDPSSAAKESVIGRMAKINPITNPSFSVYAHPYQVRESL